MDFKVIMFPYSVGWCFGGVESEWLGYKDGTTAGVDEEILGSWGIASNIISHLALWTL